MDLSWDSIFARVCVRDPYFALDALTRDGDGVTALVRPEQPLDGEEGPIAAAEAGRHLAILGSCAAALVNPDPRRHYYLARKALLTRGAGANEAGSGTALRARAHASLEGRRARATSSLETPDGQPVHRLEVEYAVLGEAVFARVFRQARVEMRSPTRHADDDAGRGARTNPYADPLPVTAREVNPELARAHIPAVEASLCKGHFPLHPTLPVAIVMRALSDLAGAHLRATRGHAQHTVQSADVDAETLANAGEHVVFEARPAGDGLYHCVASAAGGRIVGTMRLALTSR